MSHEIAHAITHHGAEQMIQQLLINGVITFASISFSDNEHYNLIMAAF